MVGADVIGVVHRFEVATDVCATTTISVDDGVTCHYLWILWFNSKTQLVYGDLHDLRKR